MKFIVKGSYGIRGSRILFTVYISDFEEMMNDKGIKYTSTTAYGEALYDFGYLNVIKDSFKYQPGFHPPRDITEEEAELIEKLLNDSEVWTEAVKHYSKLDR